MAFAKQQEKAINTVNVEAYTEEQRVKHRQKSRELKENIRRISESKSLNKRFSGKKSEVEVREYK